MSKEAIEALERALEKERMDGSPENCRATNKALTSLRSSPPPPSELVEAGEAIPKEEASIALWSLRGTLENIRFNIRHYESMTEADIDLMDRGKTLQDLRRDEDGLTKSIALISRAKSSQPSPWISVDRNIIDRIIDKWGHETQVNKIQEEALELALVLNQRNCPTKNGSDMEAGLYDELADMHIMMAQSLVLFDRERIAERVRFKLQRVLEKHLNALPLHLNSDEPRTA